MMQEEILEIRSTADRFLSDNIDQFDPFGWETPEKSELRRKAFTELGLYLFVLDQYGGSNPTIRRHVTRLVNDGRYQELLRRYPTRFTQNAFPAIVLQLADELEEATGEAVSDAFRSPRTWGIERYPYQLVALLMKARLWGYDGHDYRLETVMETSNLVHPPDVIGADESEFYYLTHNVMLPTAFGADRPELFDAPLPYDLEPILTGALLRSMAAGNADAVLELLITGVLQDQLPDNVIRYAVRWVYEEKTTETHVIAPTMSTTDDEPGRNEIKNPTFHGKIHPAEEWGPETRHWAKHYHANVVAGSMTYVLNGVLDLPSFRTGTVSLSSREFDDLLALGSGLNLLHTYDLSGAADVLATVRSETFRMFPELSRRIVGFIESQDTGGSIGNWVDERRLYEQTTGDVSNFERELVAPITEQCRALVNDISAALSTAPPDQPR